MANQSVGTIFVELDLDPSRYMRAQQTIRKEAESGAKILEKNFKNLGIKSSAHFDLLRAQAVQSFEAIKRSGKATTDDLVRAERAKADRIKKINDEQFGHQTSLLTKFKDHWLAISAAVYGAMRLMSAGWDMMKEAANFEQQQKSFANLASSYGANSNEIVEQLKKVSSNTISTMTLIEKAGTAMMMGIDPDKIVKLMEIARATARMTGQSVSQAFSDISLAVGRQSKMILDNLGIIVSVDAANKAYAKTLNKTAKELTDVERKQAFLYATVEAGTDLIERLGEQTDTTRDKMDRLSAVVANFKIQVGLATIALVGLIEKLTDKALDVLFGPAQGDPKKMYLEQLKLQLDQYTKMHDLMVGLPNIAKEDIKIGEQKILLLKQSIAILEDEIALRNRATSANRLGAVGGFAAGFVSDVRAGGGSVETIDKKMLALEERAALEMAKSQETLSQKTNMEIFMEQGLTDALYEMRQKRLEDETGFAQKRLELRQMEHDTALEMMKIEQEQELAIAQQLANQKAQIKYAELNLYGAIGDSLIAIGMKQGKAQFAMQKAWQVGQAVMAAWLAHNLALANPPGPPWTEPLAAAALKQGLIGAGAIAAASIGQIASYSGGGGGGAITSPSYPAYTPPSFGEENKGTFHIHIEGPVIGDESYIEMLAEKISEAVENRDVILVSSNAKYAENLS